jgi:fructose-bisphosphate aldolase class I
MDIDGLIGTARAMVADDKGILAMDESTATCHQRFAQHGIPTTVEARRAYRELLVTAPGLGESISGAILFDETIHQGTAAGVPFVELLRRAGIVPGIKVDLGAHELAGFPGERVTDGLDGLRARLADYARLGARFTKWRAVIAIGDGLPTAGCIAANAHALARFAALSQEAGLVPMVEPEVLMDGDHTLQRCALATREALQALYEQLFRQRVDLRGTILKASMVIPGARCPQQEELDQVADATVACLRATVPAAVPGVAFLSGGQTAELATARLNAMAQRHGAKAPWALTFSFSRALQEPALRIWKGRDGNVAAAQAALVHRAVCNRAARRGQYHPAMETRT